jgi:hypothetical protein
MGQQLTLDLEESQIERLDRLARRIGKSQVEMGAILLEEGLREADFSGIEFRDSPVGRQAYMKGSSLAVWEVLITARGYGMEISKVAHHLARPPEWVQAAFRYYAAFKGEIDAAMAESDATDFEALKKQLPSLELVEVSLEPLPDEE